MGSKTTSEEKKKELPPLPNIIIKDQLASTHASEAKKKELRQLTGKKDAQINISEVKRPELDAA